MEGGNDIEDSLVTNSKTYKYLKEKYDYLSQRVSKCVENIIKRGTDVKGLNFTIKSPVINTQGKSPEQVMLEQQRLQEPQVVILQIEELVIKLMNLTSSTIKAIENREDSLNGAFDEALLRLQREIRHGLQTQQKLNTKIECLETKLETIFKSFHNSEEMVRNLQQEITKTKSECAAKVKQQEQEIVNLRKENETKKLDRRKTRVFNPSNGEEVQAPSSSAQLSSSQVPPNNINEVNNQFNFQGVGERPSTTGLVNRSQSSKLMLKADNFELLRKSLVRVNQEDGKSKEAIKLANELMDAHRMQEMDLQKHQYDVNRFNIQIRAQEMENQKLKENLYELQVELKTIKEEIAQQQQNKWAQQILSDKNPNLIDYYKQKLDEKDKEIKQLKKAQKQFVIMEKKLFVKEKAFQYERKDYHDTLIFLNDRANKLDKKFRDAQTTKTQQYSHLPSTVHNEGSEN